MKSEWVKNSWRRLLVEEVFCRQYPLFFSIVVPCMARNSLFESLIPSLLQVKAVTVLDEALRIKLADEEQEPKDYGLKNDLYGRIETAVRRGILEDSERLHQARNRRNDVSHEFAEAVDWSQLRSDISVIHEALQRMGFVTSAFPDLEVKTEHVPKETAALKDPRAVFGFDYTVTAHEGNVVWGKMEWTHEVLNDDEV